MAAKPRKPLAPDFDPAHAVALILKAHERFLQRIQTDDPEDAKGVATQHAAGRAVLAHAEHVLKVAAMVGARDAPPDLAALLAEARAQMTDDEEESESDDSAGGEADRDVGMGEADRDVGIGEADRNFVSGAS
jgi:hypothetical protein